MAFLISLLQNLFFVFLRHDRLSLLFQGKSGGKLAAASFQDELELFSGKQDLNTIVRSDYTGHTKVGVERHKPKDQIEVG